MVYVTPPSVNMDKHGRGSAAFRWGSANMMWCLFRILGPYGGGGGRGSEGVTTGGATDSLTQINPFKPEFTIVIFIHYKPRIAVAIHDL